METEEKAKKPSATRTTVEKYKETRDLPKLAEEYTEVFAGSHNNILRTIDTIFFNNDRSDKTEVWWLYGPTGPGKSRQAQTMAHGHIVYWKYSTEWWDHYSQEEYVIIDDYAGQWKIDFLQLLDQNPLLIQCKPGTKKFNSKYIIFTSNYHPGHYCKYLEEQY
ncbi:uncharacterized protein DEA37_0014711 [Paragonimus westermani]|uniref:Helicase superfamily 3 single-stranded DNA/RNA virus domain-containing protein n=1 Tax=Paragonimus westermani TaxID=34504 RepID=A0A5J4NL11_9TREM|nr:uncharacterized protein DEA37_0014711 [Paragonimus westermani]